MLAYMVTFERRRAHIEDCIYMLKYLNQFINL